MKGMRMKKKVFWILSGFFGFAALGFFLTAGGFVAGLFALMITVLFIPISPLQNKISSYVKGKWKVLLSVVLLVCFFVTVPLNESTGTDRSFPADVNDEAVVQSSEDVEEETGSELVDLETLKSDTDPDPTVEEPTSTVPDTTETERATRGTEATVATTQATTTYTEATMEGNTTVATETYTTEAPTAAATTYNTEPTYTHATTVDTEMTTASAESNGRNYVINTNTGKFHYPSCSSVKDIKPENRWDYCGTRDDVIGMGYIPCRRCDP